MIDITGHLTRANVTRYLCQIEMGPPWVALKDPKYPIYEASMKEQRFNQAGEAAFYMASGRETARANVPDRAGLIECHVASQKITCFNLYQFSIDHGITDEYLRHQKEGGYPLPQETANLLLRDHGVTGLLFQSAAGSGICLVLRPESGKSVGIDFFAAGAPESGVGL